MLNFDDAKQLFMEKFKVDVDDLSRRTFQNTGFRFPFFSKKQPPRFVSISDDMASLQPVSQSINNPIAPQITTTEQLIFFLFTDEAFQKKHGNEDETKDLVLQLAGFDEALLKRQANLMHENDDIPNNVYSPYSFAIPLTKDQIKPNSDIMINHCKNKYYEQLRTAGESFVSGVKSFEDIINDIRSGNHATGIPTTTNAYTS